MATTSPYSGRERHHAERLSVCSGLTRAKIEQTTGIHLNTLSRWAKAEDWAQRRDTYRALALSVPEIMQAHALKMQAWAEEEKATTPRELNASVESGNKAMYALCLADQAYRAHAKMNHLDEIYLDDYETPKWAKNPTLVEQDFTRIKSEYYPALREGGSLIIVHNIFTAVGVMARCKDDPDMLTIDSPLITNGIWDEETRRYREGQAGWPGRCSLASISRKRRFQGSATFLAEYCNAPEDDNSKRVLIGGCMDHNTEKNGQNHQFTIKASKYLKTLSFE